MPAPSRPRRNRWPPRTRSNGSKLFEALEEAGLFYLVGGRLYQDIREVAETLTPEHWGHYQSGQVEWTFAEFFGPARELGPVSPGHLHHHDE